MFKQLLLLSLASILLCLELRPVQGEDFVAEEVGHSYLIERLPDPDPNGSDAELTEFELPAPPPRKRSGDNSNEMGPPGMGGGPALQFNWFPRRKLQSGTGDMQITRGQVSLGLPISKSEAGGIWLVTGSWAVDSIQTNARLDSIGRDFPDEITSIKMGLMHIRRLENGWKAGGMVNVGSASDKPFASIDEVNANLLAFLTVPKGERDAWSFSLMYSPLGQLSFPIPGVAYQWRPNEQLSASVGIPFSLSYKPTETVQMSLSYIPVTNVNAQIRWSLWEQLALYTGYSSNNQGYLLSDRQDVQQRLFEFDQRVAIGARYNLGPSFVLDLSGGYLFDQSFFLSDSFFSRHKQDRIRVDNGTYIGLRLEFVPP